VRPRSSRDMADGAQWLVGAAAWASLLSMCFSIAGLLVPWWTSSIPAEYAPIKTEVSLWLSNTQWTIVQDGGVTRHYGCTNKCDKARFSRPRVVSKCQTWDDISTWANELCDSGYASRAESIVTTSTSPPIPFMRNGEAPGTYDRSYTIEDVDNYANPNSPVEKEVPLPASNWEVSTYRPVEFGFATTTTTLLTTITTTTVTTTIVPGQTKAPTPRPDVTTPLLGAAFCEPPSLEEIAQAPYTEWEINFDLGNEIMERLYARLTSFLGEVPYFYFAQRPTRHEQVRLIWEVYMERSPPDYWLGLYVCPSVPARELHAYIWADPVGREATLMRRVLEQAFEPPNVPLKGFVDWAMKEAWEEEILDITTTTLPGFADPYATTITYRETTLPPAPFVAPSPAPPPPFAPDVATILQCHQAEYDPLWDADAPFAWYEAVSPCDLVSNLDKVWAARASLLLAIFLTLGHSFPSAVLFIGSNERFTKRFPPMLGFWLGAGAALSQVIAVVVGSMMTTEPDTMSGPGFFAAIAAIVLSILSMAASKLGEVVAKALQSPVEEYPGVVVGNLEHSQTQLHETARVRWDKPAQPAIARVAWNPSEP